MSEKSNPCQSCGACCASFRVSFYWAEADDGGGLVPSHLTEKLNDWTRCMRGTWSASPRCAALQGEVGDSVGCGVYPLRPSPCREVEAGSAQCLKARASHGLPALRGAPAAANEAAPLLAG
ncbi:YkgJ family cysteine cluster protein [Chromobacterium subtsugae]|uniref:YkgJ family cysteine cluster protein n=1 Tax=Chromobacterium subtsugae TaxID=251747 RepID=A0ABS7FCC2_9NEIS|nr:MULTISPECIES: YkgJ family cysteine cluster protein [Chromobacterium]KUM01816.1 ferredoxin [Chromobacterium subtsugae]KZE86749.1 ferredoxin [Chromobacterium sp. F49]MBW7568586.1 YkgJ family cysteine cluster protein [Chromobacterium subtsugae]MBW8287621.1 YkgJ family cysteine cluster protein [Chromobacterium subtsugae]OBU84702.1 ferredoxin [Chromobacterium subtsugae]